MILFAFIACDEMPSLVDCPDIATLSSVVDLVDDSGVPIQDAVVEYSVDGADFVACETWTDEVGRYECGWESSGPFTVRASAEGYIDGSVDFVVGPSEDGCTVDTETVELALEEIPCTLEEVPGVMATVTGDPEAEVYWSLANADMAPTLCEDYGDGVWACGYESSGQFAIDVYGQTATESALVDVDHDGCHPITEELRFDLPVDEDIEPAEPE